MALPKIKKCFICKEPYDNYYRHVISPLHKKKQNSFIYTRDKTKVGLANLITNLVDSLNEKGPKNETDPKNEKRSRIDYKAE